MSKSLILIRHGHRDISRRELDNGLTEKGRDQARTIRRFFTNRFKADDLRNGLWLASSPKQRCLETLQPLAKAISKTVDIHPDLNERGSRESLPHFEQRVHRFLHEWSESEAGMTVLCSHGDWLPIAIFHLLGLDQSLKKGSWFELEWRDGKALLKWYMPTFKPFYG